MPMLNNPHPQTVTDRELDALVAEKVKALAWYDIREAKTIYGDQNFVALTYRDDMRGYYEIPHYSTDITAAFQVVEKMRDDWYFACDTRYPELLQPWWAEFATLEHQEGGQATAGTLPRAICLAALKALGVEVPA